MIGNFVFTIIGALLLASFTLGDNLVARRLNTTLPTPMIGVSLYYDGKSDFIYLVGGSNGDDYLDSILRFDISTEAIQQIGTLSRPSVESPLEADSAGNLIYFDGINLPSSIYKIDIDNNSIQSVGSSKGRPFHSASAKNAAGRVLLLGGELGLDIWEYKVDSDIVRSEIVGQLPASFSSAAAIKVTNSTVLLFGSNNIVSYLELDLETLETKDVAVDSFPGFQGGMRVTNDRNNVYLFGGNFTTSGIAVDGIIQLDPVTHSWNFLQVDNFPIIPTPFLRIAPEVIFVEKLNRIYMFGGGVFDGNQYVVSDEIHYIEFES